MEWMISNWILLLIAALCIVMYFFGKRYCVHGKEGCDMDESGDETKDEKKGGCCCH